MDLTKDALQMIVDNGACRAVFTTGCDPFVIIPNSLKVEDVQRFYPPTRIRQTVNLTTPGSFADYVNRFKDADTLMFAKVTDTDGQFLAVLDYHEAATQATAPTDKACGSAPVASKPRHACHRARYTVEKTTEWTRWMEANKKAFSQVEFAVWLEENQDLLVEPTGADLLELVCSLEGHNNARFNSTFRLDSGKNALHYDEDVVVKGVQTTAAGMIEIPQVIQAGISPFHGIEKYRVRAWLKYRVSGRSLTFWFESVSPHLVIRDAIAGICEGLKEKTGVPLLLGSLD